MAADLTEEENVKLESVRQVSLTFLYVSIRCENRVRDRETFLSKYLTIAASKKKEMLIILCGVTTERPFSVCVSLTALSSEKEFSWDI